MNVQSVRMPVLAAVLGILPDLSAQAADRAGQATVVQDQAYQNVDALPASLYEGAVVYRQAEITTKRFGHAELYLDDGSTLSVGPNAGIVIDDYVYNPDTESGQAALSLVTGAVRMLSGKIGSGNVRIRTPVATVGIRGTVFYLAATGDGLNIWVEEGAVSVAPNNSAQEFIFEAPAFASCSSGGCEEGGSASVPVLQAPSIGDPSDKRERSEPNSGDDNDSSGL